MLNRSLVLRPDRARFADQPLEPAGTALVRDAGISDGRAELKWRSLLLASEETALAVDGLASWV